MWCLSYSNMQFPRILMGNNKLLKFYYNGLGC